MIESIRKFWETVDQIYGAYLDANSGFHAFREKITQIQSQMTTSSGGSLQDLDSRLFIHGHGDPNNADSRVLHKVTQGELKHRNRKNGENTLFLGSMSLVAIYQFWEDRFRGEISSEINIPREELKHDLLGDIRLIRIAIIHHGGIAKKEIEKCRVLKWFKEGDEIVIDEPRMDTLITELQILCNNWIDHFGSSKI